MGLADLLTTSSSQGTLSRYTGYPTNSGRAVDEESALEISAVFDAVRGISSTIASVPLITFRRESDGGTERATEHWAYKLLKEKPNPLINSFDFRMMMNSHMELWGNCYANIERDGQGRVNNLWPIPPNRIKDIRERDGSGTPQLEYLVHMPDDNDRRIRGSDMFHVKMWQIDSHRGLSPIQKAAETLGINKAAREFGARFFDNDATPGGVIQHPEELSDKAHDHLKKSWNESHQGVERSHRINILEEGAEFQEIGMPPEDAQMIQTQKFSVVEVARFYNIPPHKIKSLERATFSNIENQNIDWVISSVRPRAKRWEQALNNQILDGQDRIFAEYMLQGLMRGDAESRMNYLAQGIQNGIIEPNEARRKENFDPHDEGGNLMIQKSLSTMENRVNAAPDPNGQGSPSDVENDNMSSDTDGMKFAAVDEIDRTEITATERLEQADEYVEDEYRELFGEIVRREQRELKSLLSDFAGEGQLSDFFREAGSFLVGQLRPHIRDKVQPVFRQHVEDLKPLLRREIGDDFLEKFDGEEVARKQAERTGWNYSTTTRSKLQNIQDTALQDVEGEQRIETTRTEIENIADGRADREAQDRGKKLMNRTTQAAFVASPTVTRKVWLADRDNCPACDALNGAVVGVEKSFVGSGESITSGWSSGSTVISPPLHRGGDCVIAAR